MPAPPLMSSIRAARIVGAVVHRVVAGWVVSGASTAAWLRGVLLCVELFFYQCAPRGLCMVAVMERRKYGIVRALLASAFRVALRVEGWLV